MSDPKRTGAAARLAAWRDRDHTQGSLIGSLFVLALPMMLSSGLIVAYQLVDLAFISRLGEAPMTAVIIVNQTLRQFVMMAVMGMSFGTQALIARAIGMGNNDLTDSRRIPSQQAVDELCAHQAG